MVRGAAFQSESALQHAGRSCNHAIWIRDAQNPTNQSWAIDGKVDHHSVDYAIITRYFDNETNEWVLGLCGLWSYGTEAAANLLVEPEFFRLLPDSWARQELSDCIKTSVINGNTGVPQILLFIHGRYPLRACGEAVARSLRCTL